MNHVSIFGQVQNVQAINNGNGASQTMYVLAVPRGGNAQQWDYFQVNAIGKQAEFAAKLQNGANVLVSGYLQNSGIEKTDTEFIIPLSQSVMQPIDMPYVPNTVILIGRLTRDPDVRQTNNDQKTVANCRIAVDRAKTPNGEKQADYFDVIAFDKSGDFASKYLKKGTKVVVTGYIRNNNYKNREGVDVYRDAVYAQRLEFAESKAATSGTAQPAQYGAAAPAAYGAPMMTPYGAPTATQAQTVPTAQAAPYGAAAPTYGAPMTPYGAPAQPTPTPAYGVPAQQAPLQQTPTAPASMAPATRAPMPAPTQQAPAPAAQAPMPAPAQQVPVTNPYGVPVPAQQTPAPTQAPAQDANGFAPVPTGVYMDNGLPFA